MFYGLKFFSLLLQLSCVSAPDHLMEQIFQFFFNILLLLTRLLLLLIQMLKSSI